MELQLSEEELNVIRAAIGGYIRAKKSAQHYSSNTGQTYRRLQKKLTAADALAEKLRKLAETA